MAFLDMNIVLAAMVQVHFFFIACLLFYMCCEGLIISLLFSVTTFAKYLRIQYDHVFAIMSSYALVSYARTVYRWLVF